MRLPLGKKIKKRLHLDVALLQDELIHAAYDLENRLVLHGGTAVWRCYGGNRFSEDLDFYGPVDRLYTKLPDWVKLRNLTLSKLKKTENLLFAKISTPNAEVRLEVNFASQKEPIVAPYERVDGSVMDVFTLSPEQLILEKISAYSNRRFIRDAYDLYHLSSSVTLDGQVAYSLRLFLENVAPPADESNLRTLVYAGAVPTFTQMIDALRRRLT